MTGFWENKRVIVTGGSGFLGSFVVEKLEERGVGEVIVPRSNDYDLRNASAIRRLLKTATSSTTEGTGNGNSSSIVIHLAAKVGGIGANRAYPAEFFYDNLIMGVQVLHESWKAGIDKFVSVGTVCAYPKYTPTPFSEKEFWNGYPEETNAPYGLAKKMLLVQSQAYRRQYGFNAIYLVPVNLYGPRDNFDLEASHVIPALIRKFVEARNGSGTEPRPTVTVWGTGKPTREFLYVEDAAEGILLAAERYNEADPVNLGSGMEISIEELVNLLARLTEFQGEISWDSSRPDGQPKRLMDISQASKLFGFWANTSFESGVSKTIDWYQQHRLS